MKAVLSWFCCLAVTTQVCAMTGLEAYYQADYKQAATLLKSKANLTALEEYYMGRMYLYGYGVLKSNTLADQSFKRAADKGSLLAQLLLAKIELFQNNNPEQALLWFKKAAKSNDVSAQMYCAGAYLYGVGTVKKADSAREYYLAAARANQGIAQQMVAADFLKSKQNASRKMGLVWLNKAVALRDPEAEVMLAGLYLTGDLVAKNKEQARQLLEDAASQEYLPAYYQMGRFQASQGNTLDAQNWYQKAAERHDTQAQIALAELYLDRNNASYSLQEGFVWMQKAAQSGVTTAQHALATMYQKGEGVEANQVLAAEWEHKAQLPQASGPENAQQLMAEWLTRGKAESLANTDYQLSGIQRVWHDQSALQNNIYNQAPQLPILTRQDIYQPKLQMLLPNDLPIHQYFGAMMNAQAMSPTGELIFPLYTLPNGLADVVSTEFNTTNKLLQAQRDGFDYLTQATAFSQAIDYPETFKRLLKQAVLGDSTAQFDVAQMYQQGVGVTKSIEAAIKFYHLAAAQNDLPSEYHLGLIYLQGMGVEPDYRVGMDWLLDAAFKGNYYAQYTLARIYEYGYRDKNGREVVPADKDQSYAMYQLSASNHYGLAQYRLAEILVRQPMQNLTAADLDRRHKQIKRLFQGAADFGVEDAKLPMAFYDASDADEAKQAQAFATIQHAANTGSIEAAFLLGMMYDRGIATRADRERAIYWYEQAVANPMSAFILGTYLAEGSGIAKNIEKATDYLQFAASKNFAAADFNLAVLKKQQNEDFLIYLEKAAAQGLSSAGLALADYYMSRDSTTEQLKQARNLYEQFAKQGLQTAQLKLGYLYEQGLGAAQDYKQALTWYTAAAQQKPGQAQYLLGRLYQLGKIETTPNYATAQQWYAAVKANYAPAAVAAGFIDETVRDDYRHAFNDYQQAADMGDPIAEYNLALIYEKGKSQSVDIDKAQIFYQRAAKQKVTKAMVALGHIYVNEHNINKALIWLNLAATQNDADALYQLGWLSEKGLIPHATIPDAVTYYQEAAAQGQGMAILALARLYQSGLGVKRNLAKSAEYYTQLAQQNYPEAQYQLAKFCLSKIAKGCSQQEAKNWLVKAEHNGHHDASQLLRLLAARSQSGLSYVESIPVT